MDSRRAGLQGGAVFVHGPAPVSGGPRGTIGKGIRKTPATMRGRNNDAGQGALRESR